MDAKTVKSELTRTVIVDAAVDLAAEQGLEAITLQAVADRVGLSKSGVFSRVGSREALQKAVVDEWGRRFLADVMAPALATPRGLARLQQLMARWMDRTRLVEARTGCIYTAGAFELDDREGELRKHLLAEVLRWRAALARTVAQAVQNGELRADTDALQVAAEMNAIVVGLLHDTRFLRDPQAPARAATAWKRLLRDHLA